MNMRKVLCLLAIAALAAVASCNKGKQVVDADDELVSVSFTVSTGVATRATTYGDGELASDLTVQVFRKDVGAGETVVWTPTTPTITKTKLGTSPESWTVTMKLAKTYNYRVGFWAQSASVPAGAFDITDLRAVAVDYTKFAINTDNLDVFCNYAEITNMAGSLTETVELKRPLAQVNLLANDYADYVNTVPTASATALKVAVKIENVPNTLNVITKETSGEATLDLTAAAAVNDTFETTEYYYLSMAYILGKQAQALADATLVLSNDTQTPLATVTVSNMPYRANYKTNILGQLLTGSATYTVVIVPAFTTPAYEPTPTVN